MWICSRCQSSNEETHARCLQCGAPRSARRFGAGTPVLTPSVEEQSSDYGRERAFPAPRPDGLKNPSAHGPAAREDQPSGRADRLPFPEKRRVRCAAGRWLVAVGLVLAALLPLLCLYLSFAQRDRWPDAVAGLFFPAGASPAAGLVLYVVLTALSALLLMLPGLTAAGLGRLLIRLTPPRRPR